MQYLTPRYFLLIGGAVLLALGIIGFINSFASLVPDNKIFYLDTGENVAHTVLGVVALLLATQMKEQASLLKTVVVLVGLIALFFGLYGFILVPGDTMHPNAFGLGNLESPLDNLLHLVVAAWAFASAFVKAAPMAKSA